jgi:hypothetical protein
MSQSTDRADSRAVNKEQDTTSGSTTSSMGDAVKGAVNSVKGAAAGVLGSDTPKADLSDQLGSTPTSNPKLAGVAEPLKEADKVRGPASLPQAACCIVSVSSTNTSRAWCVLVGLERTHGGMHGPCLDAARAAVCCSAFIRRWQPIAHSPSAPPPIS